MARSPGLFPETKTPPLFQTCAKRKRNFNGGTWNDAGMEGGDRSNAGSFWHQVRKKPELWTDKTHAYAHQHKLTSVGTVRLRPIEFDAEQ
jgi:hypothetical protein